jgi:hypothetical protein
MAPFEVGEAVVCVDASDIPAPWKPLECGHSYVIRSIDPVDGTENVPHNVHKNSRWCVRVWGVNNLTMRQAAEALGLGTTRTDDFELAYAASRFEKIQPDEVCIDTTSKIKEVA